MDTICCYAVQGEFLVTDPGGNEWDLFYTKSDSEVQQIGASLEVENNKTPFFNCLCFELILLKKPELPWRGSSGLLYNT